MGSKSAAVIWSREVAANRGILKYYFDGDVVGTKVGGHYRQGSHSSEVVVKRGSTVQAMPMWISMVDMSIM